MKKSRKLFAFLFAMMMVAGLVGAAPAKQVKADEFNAYLMFTDNDWGWANWDENVANTTVTGDGTYSVTLSKSAFAEAPANDAANGAQVFCVDVVGIASAVDPASLVVSDVKILCDGVEVAVDQSKIAFGDIEEKGNLRIELYNVYGLTKDDAPIDAAAFTWSDTLTVEFTLSGMSGAAEGGEAGNETEGDTNVGTDAEYTVSLGAQFNTEVNADFEEWPDCSGFDKTFRLGEETTFTCDFGQTVAFAGNYVAINTNIPYSSALTAEVKSIKVDGNEVAFEAENLFLNDEGTDGGLRLTIVNLWNADTTPMLDAAALGSFNTFEVTFVVNEDPNAGAEGGDDTASAEIDINAEYTVGLGAQFNTEVNADFGEWPDCSGFDKTFRLGEETTFTCDFGQTVAFAGNFVGINTNIPYSAALTAEIKSIKVDGNEAAFEAENLFLNDEGTDGGLRLTIVNLWNTDTTPMLDAAALGSFNTFEVTFVVNVSDEPIEAEPTPTEEPAPAVSVDLNGTYHAYLGFQTPTFSFRNAFDDATYGRDSEYFNVVCGWDSSNALITKSGTFTDAEIAGNGTYTVSVEGLDLSGDFDSQEYFNLLFLSTDIPNTEEITISDIELRVEGSSVDISPIVSPDSPDWLNILIQNIWNPDVKEIGYYKVPPTKMSITFTVSGFAYDKAPDPTEAPAEATPTPVPAESAKVTESAPSNADSAAEESGSNTGLIVGIVIAVVVVAAVVVVVVAKKKK